MYLIPEHTQKKRMNICLSVCLWECLSLVKDKATIASKNQVVAGMCVLWQIADALVLEKLPRFG